MGVANSDLIPVLIAALDGPEAEASLAAGVAVLREHGLAVASSERVWLELSRGTRMLTLAAAHSVEPPDVATFALLSHLLGTALTRVLEHDEYRRVQERAQLLSEASFEGLALHADAVAIDVNARFCELLGATREELLQPGAIVRFMAPEDLGVVMSRIRDRVEGEFLVTLVRKDGTPFRAELCIKQSRLGLKPVRVMAVRDVTQRERSAELLRESEARLRSMLEASFDNVVVTRDGIVVEVGGHSAPFFGVTREDLIGRSVVDFIAPVARGEMVQRFKTQTAGKYETTAIAPNGELIPVEVVSVIATLDGEPVRVAGLRDLREARRAEAERLRLERQVERSQRLESLGVLASGLAHDFNNLLVGVLGSAELLLCKLQRPDERALAESILMAGERAASLTQQMLVYAGRRELRAPEPVDLSTVWQELRGLLDAALSKKARIELSLGADCLVLGERATLMQVLMNLLTNASDALEGKVGSIQVRTRRVVALDSRWRDALGANLQATDWVLVEVSDTGAGMDEATRARIFEPFFTTKPKGHGLGLGACLGIVAAHGGAILVESNQGAGSTFSVALPATTARSEAQLKTTATQRPCRVVIIDDEVLVRVHVQRLLEQRGFSVQVAGGALEGLSLLAGVETDLVLLDLSMPDLDGVELVRRLRAQGSRVPVVLCSGNLEGAVTRGLEQGMVQALLHKPFSSEELLSAIERARAGM